jgi:tetratricopeptide (TPR) repeat protein
MHNQSTFVKIVIWFMVFLMSAGFAALVISPFASNLSIFGGSNGRSATKDLVTEARADIKKDHCDSTTDKPTGKRLARCEEAYKQLGSSYTTLSQPTGTETTPPRDSKRNTARAGEAYRALYELDKNNAENAAIYAGYLRDTQKTTQALEIFTALVKAHPNNQDYLLQQAGAYESSNQLDKAIEAFQLFIKRFPDDGQVSSVKDEIKALRKQQIDQTKQNSSAAPVTVN